MKRSLISSLLTCTLIGTGAASLGGCSQTPPSEQTLADLARFEPDKYQRSRVETDLARTSRAYRELLAIHTDPDVQAVASFRLADLSMVANEDSLAESGIVPEQALQQLITTYQQLLAEHSGRVGNDAVYYQLAKALALKGENDASFDTLTELTQLFPESDYADEANFRRGDALFSQGEYNQAEKAFAAAQVNEESPYFVNAAYMQGWSRFKLGYFEAAQTSYLKVLDRLLLIADEPDELPRGQLTMYQDTMRVMSLTFSYQHHGESVAALMEQQGQRVWQHLLYRHLAELLLDKELYSESADTYSHYIDRFPNTIWAARFHLEKQDIYQQAGFVSLLRDEQQQFVKGWGGRSEFWRQASQSDKAEIAPVLRKYLKDLALYHHAKAQALASSLGSGRTEEVEGEQTSVASAYLKAADWYRQYVETFPEDSETPHQKFMMAETLYLAGEIRQAVNTYMDVAYPLQAPFAEPAQAAEAGYAAVVGLEQLITEGSDEAMLLALRQEQLDLQLQFADRFADDTRADKVMAKATETALDLQLYPLTIATATRLLARLDKTAESGDPNATKQDELYRTTYLSLGHAQFELAQFALAENAYGRALSFMNSGTEMHRSMRKKMAAAIYRQGEDAVSAGQESLAIDHFLRLGVVVPESGFRMNAEYDAATLLLKQDRNAEAIQVLVAFRQRYPKSKFIQALPAKLALAFEQEQSWQLAAREYLYLAEHDQDPEARREALLTAAEMYEKADDLDNMIVTFRRYAHAYPQPFDMATEIRYKMSQFYQRTGEDYKRFYWLKKLIKYDTYAGELSTDRSRYLAAYSARELALNSQKIFDGIRLKLPLAKSLKRKKKALETVLSDWQRVAAYQRAEFSTEATYRIARVYADLSSALLESDRPSQLDELALEQYELLLEEQAYPFEEQAIAIHQTNARYAWSGQYDSWVKRSFAALAELMPAQYQKQEQRHAYSRHAH